MASKVKPIPEGYHSVTPYLSINGASNAIDFYKKVFGAKEIMRFADPSGKIGHGEIEIGGSRIMLADEFPEMNFRSPKSTEGISQMIHLYVEDVDAIFNKAIAADAQPLRAVADQFYGDRVGVFKDPFGHVWSVATHKEDISPEEMEKRAAEAAKNKK